jgi:hypothetical protein
MPAALQILDADGAEVTLDDSAPVDFGTVTSGTASEPRMLKVRNAGDADVFFARVRAVAHPSAHVGAGADTYRATEFALMERDDYAPELELGTLVPGAERAFWVRWAVPGEAPAGAVVWAVEVVASTT